MLKSYKRYRFLVLHGFQLELNRRKQHSLFKKVVIFLRLKLWHCSFQVRGWERGRWEMDSQAAAACWIFMRATLVNPMMWKVNRGWEGPWSNHCWWAQCEVLKPNSVTKTMRSTFSCLTWWLRSWRIQQACSDCACRSATLSYVTCNLNQYHIFFRLNLNVHQAAQIGQTAIIILQLPPEPPC